MKINRPTAILVSAGLGVVGLVGSIGAGTAASPKQIPTVVVTNDIPAGSTIQANDLATVTVKGSPLPGTYRKTLALVGRRAAVTLKSGQPVVAGDVTSGAPVRNGLTPGQVGVTVSVSLASSGLAKPGNYVDVYLGQSQSNATVKIPNPVVSDARVVQVVNTQAAATTGGANQVGGANAVPAAVEIAVPQGRVLKLIEARSAYRLVLVQSPWVLSIPKSLGSSASGSGPVSQQTLGSRLATTPSLNSHFTNQRSLSQQIANQPTTGSQTAGSRPSSNSQAASQPTGTTQPANQTAGGIPGAATTPGG